MAQKQFTTYQADILSFELREAILGIARPGRYSGYDQIAADGTPDGTIYLKLSHSSEGVQKLAKGGSSLGDPIGVAITTQGTIIHEDQQIDIDIPDNNAGGDFRWYIIYMEHDYVEVQGANNATYGYIAGSDDNVIPTLTEAYHRVPLGYIRADDGATSISGLTYFPANSTQSLGDDKLNSILWGDDAINYFNKENEAGAEVGVIPSDGIIGNRRYVEQNYVVNGESVSDSLDSLDIQMADVVQALFDLGLTKLDDWGTPDDNTDLNATSSYHGLLPKLSGEVTQFLNGGGAWSIPYAGFIFKDTNATGYDNNASAHGGTITMGSTFEWDVSGLVPVGYDQVILMVQLECLWGAGNTLGRYGRVIFSQGSSQNNGFFMDGPMPFEEGSIYASVSYLRSTQVGVVKLSASRTIRISWGNYSGQTTDWLYDIKVRVVAYR